MEKPACWIGLNTGWPDVASSVASQPSARLTCRAAFRLVQDMRVPLVRDGVMDWGMIQPAAGKAYDFSQTDEYIRQAQKAKAEPLIVFRHVPAWAVAGANTEPAVRRAPARTQAAAFAAFVADFVERYDGDGKADLPGMLQPVHAYEFMQEIEDIPPAEYAFWLRTFAEVARKADRNVVISCGSLTSPGIKLLDREGDYPTYFERLLAEPDVIVGGRPVFDVVSFHSFPAHYPGRAAFDDAAGYLRRTMAAHHVDVPLWLTAYGDDSGSGKEAQQAGNLVKWAIRARTLGIERVYVYALHGPGPSAQGRAPTDCGLVRLTADGTAQRKPAFAALQMLIEEIQDRPDPATRGQGLYVLKGKGEPKYVLWKEDAYEPAPMLIPGWWEIRSISGATCIRQGSEIHPTESPLFLRRASSPFIE